jgi:cellulose synthase (UDP-forming)
MTPQVQPRQPQQPRLIAWLLGLPSWFESLMPWAGKWHLFWLVILLLVLSVPLIITPLSLPQQLLLAGILIGLSWLIVKSEQRQGRQHASQGLHLFLAWLSIVATFRYLFYRFSYTLNLDGWVNGFFSILLFAAELYAVATLLLSYFQTLQLKERRSIDLSAFPVDRWFTVDVFIPTYNEDVAIVRKTALAAMAIDYPADKKQVYVLDDGRKFPERRAQLQQMCDELGCVLLTRDNNDHAKAGNINTALQRTFGDLILILDCDHIPSRQFLQETVGFFFQPKVALVQTPHWFYNPDPFERNLLTQGHVPASNELFYKVIQKGNDFWNSAFFCGSAAIVRRQPLMEVGGIAVETVTEDCHTSLRLHSNGYDSVYYDKIMVAGLAPETFSSYAGQQARWARGMAQILRIENPLLNPRLKLTVPQRLCYFSATTHFFFGFPRIMYALAPALFLLFGINLVRGLGIETLAYAFPHIVLGLHANYITNKTARFSFWNEIFEYSLAFQEGIVTLLAVLNPKLGKFNVTDKGLSVTKRQFDWRSTRISQILTLLLILALLAVPFWLVLRPEETEPVVINAFWAIFNLVLVAAALLVALEQPQLRRAHRLHRQLPVLVHSSEQATLSGHTIDISETGVRIQLDQAVNLPDLVDLEIIGDFDRRVRLNGVITRMNTSGDRSEIAVTFVDVSARQYDDLVLVLYSDVDQWYTQQRQEMDRPWDSLRFIATGLFRAFRDPKPATPTKVRKRIHAAAQFYWQEQFYPATAVALSSRTLRLELNARSIPGLSAQAVHSAVGLLLSQRADDPTPTRLIAEVEAIEAIPTSEPVSATAFDPARYPSSYSSSVPTNAAQTLAIELRFPEQLDPQQGAKIRRLLQTLE